MTFIKKITGIIALSVVMLFAIPFTYGQMAAAQPESAIDFTDTELEKFVNAVTAIMEIEQEGQMVMLQIVMESEISLERFNEIMMADEDSIDELNVSDLEMMAFSECINQIQLVQDEMQQLMVSVISEEGFEIERYLEIVHAYGEKPELKSRIDSMFEKL